MNNTAKKPCVTCKWFKEHALCDDECVYGTPSQSDVYGVVVYPSYKGKSIQEARQLCNGEHYQLSILNALLYWASRILS